MLLEQVPADRLETDEDEHALDLDPLGLPIAVDVDPLHVAVAADLGDLSGRDRLDFVHFQKAVLKDRLRTELVPAMHHVELLGETSKEEALLEGRVAATDDREIRPLEERAVAHRAI